MRNRVEHASKRELQHLSTCSHQPSVEGCSRAGPRTPYIFHTRHATLLTRIPALVVPGRTDSGTLACCTHEHSGLQQPERALRQSPKHWQLEVQPAFMEMADARGLWRRHRQQLHRQKSHCISKVLIGSYVYPWTNH